jgi:hypothetical protein
VKPQYWLPVTVFLAVSIPLVWLLNAIEVGGEYRVWLAIAAGAIATGLVQSRMSRQQADQQDGEQA